MQDKEFVSGSDAAAPRTVTALVPLAEGFEEIEAVSVIDILRRGGVEVTVAAVGPSRDVASAHGVVIRADASLADVLPRPWDAIVLPGGGQGTENLAACEPLVERLRTMRERADAPDAGFVCAICAAPTILARFGLLGDEHVTCYPTCAEQMDRPVADAPAVADGQVITGRSPGAAMTFALVVLEHLMGSDVADAVADGLVI